MTSPVPPLGHAPDHAARNPQKLLWAFVVSVATMSLLATGLFLVALRDAAIDDARSRVDGTVRLLEEHMVRTFRATDAILGRAAALAGGKPVTLLSNNEAAWRELSALARALPEPGSLWLLDADGQARLSTITFPAKPQDLSDRHYFRAHRDGHHDLVIGPLVETKVRQALAFHLSRRIEAADGTLAGVAAVGFDVQAFTNFDRPLPLGRHASVTMADATGRVILRQPWEREWAGKDIASGPIMTAIRQGKTSGILTATSPLDGVERLLAFRLIPEFNVVVLAGEAMSDVLAAWHRMVWTAAAVVLMVGTLLGLLVRELFASLTREEALVHGLEQKVRQRTEEAEARAEDARRANDSKTRFLATASHDLRQPLQAAGMFIEALSVRMADSPHAHIVTKIGQSIEATNALLTTLLDVSTLEAGKITPNVLRFPLMPMMASLYDQVEAEASAKGLELHVVPTDLAVVSDPVLLERILRNLMINATRYTQSGGVLLGCRRRGGTVAICVIDTGIGIPADKLDTVFEDFTRLGDKGSGAQRGLGLGLGVVRRTAQLLGHRIEVQSVEGKGSCFAVVVPAA